MNILKKINLMKHQRPDDDFLRVKKSEIFGSLFQYYTIQKKISLKNRNIH